MRQELADLGVAEPTEFLPDDDDELAAFALELVMIDESVGMPTLEVIDRWLIDKKPYHTVDDAERCLEVYRGLYNNSQFHKEVLVPLAEESKRISREGDARLGQYKESLR